MRQTKVLGICLLLTALGATAARGNNECAAEVLAAGLAYIAFPVPLENVSDVFRDRRNLDFGKTRGRLVTRGRYGHEIPTLRGLAPVRIPPGEQAGKYLEVPLSLAYQRTVLVLVDPRALAYVPNTYRADDEPLGTRLRELVEMQEGFDYAERTTVVFSEPLDSLDVVRFLVPEMYRRELLGDADAGILDALQAMTLATTIYPRVQLANSYHRATPPITPIAGALGVRASALQERLVRYFVASPVRIETLEEVVRLVSSLPAERSIAAANGLVVLGNRGPRRWAYAVFEEYIRDARFAAQRAAILDRLEAFLASKGA